MYRLRVHSSLHCQKTTAFHPHQFCSLSKEIFADFVLVSWVVSFSIFIALLWTQSHVFCSPLVSPTYHIVVNKYTLECKFKFEFVHLLCITPLCNSSVNQWKPENVMRVVYTLILDTSTYTRPVMVSKMRLSVDHNRYEW